MEENILKEFGKQIRKEREQKELSQEKLADIVELHRTYIGAIERGEKNISLKNIQKIAKGLDVKISKIFTEMENMHG